MAICFIISAYCREEDMIKIKSRKQQHLFDPWQFLSPKRRKMLDQDWPGFFRRHILDLLPVKKVVPAFHRDFGRPTKEMYTVLGTLALQQYHDLTDLETSSQLSYNIQWHYALDIVEENDEAKYISPKTLWNMRTLATELGIDGELFDAATQKLAELFDSDTRHQRIDSVHIRSNMARLGRIGIFVKAIDRFLINMKRQQLSLWKKIDLELIDRYHGEKAKQCFAGIKPTKSKKTLSEVASDLYRLVTQFQDYRQVANMSTYKMLCRIIKEQCDVQSDGTIELKAPKQISSESLQNPSDPDATYSGHKGQGYQVQIMETYTEHEDKEKQASQLNLITHVQVEKASQSDAQALLPAIEATLEKDLTPDQVQADSLYGSDDNCQQAKQLGVEVISPTMGTEKGDTCSLSDFQFLSNGHLDRCPAGHQPSLRKKKKNRFSQGFDCELCEKCPLSESCPAKKGAKFFYVRYTEKTLRITKRRQHEQTEEFRQKYRWRAGVEATMSQYDRLTGVKHLRVRGFKAVRFAAVMKAMAVNIARAIAAQKARIRGQGPSPDQHFGVKRCFLLFKEQTDKLLGSFSKYLKRNSRNWTYARNIV